MQWSFGVTCWELFSGGKVPYGGLSPMSLHHLLLEGHRMEKPTNAACSDEMLALDITFTSSYNYMTSYPA